MTDLYQALAEIDAIRGQMARGTAFRGYGPATVAATGVLALVAAAIQAHSLRNPGRDVPGFLTIWTVTAALAVTIVSMETITRTRRVHMNLAKEMMHSAAEQLLPAILAGLLLTVVLVRAAPQSLWMLPGLWQIIYSLGVFASCKFVPRQMYAVGMWYLATGLMCLAAGSGDWAFSPWAMAVPFGIGQVLIAAVLQFNYPQTDEHS